MEVTNLTDEYYYVTLFDLWGPAGYIHGQPSRPRECGDDVQAQLLTDESISRDGQGRKLLAVFCFGAPARCYAAAAVRRPASRAATSALASIASPFSRNGSFRVSPIWSNAMAAITAKSST